MIRIVPWFPFPADVIWYVNVAPAETVEGPVLVLVTAAATYGPTFGPPPPTGAAPEGCTV
jgi:hypothetical protein